MSARRAARRGTGASPRRVAGGRRPVGTAGQGRALHLVDVENLAGTGRVTPRDAERCRDAYVALGLVGPGDLVVVGCNPKACLPVASAWRGTRCVVRAGEDGADLALLDVLDAEGGARRFDRFVLASGDHAFAEKAGELVAGGATVTVVSRRTSLAGALRRLPGLTILFFPDPALDLEIVA